MSKIIWVDRYSDTELPDKHNRWTRLMYVNKVIFARISQFTLDENIYLTCSLCFPTLQNDTQYLFKTFAFKDFEKAKLWCTKEFFKFKNKLCEMK